MECKYRRICDLHNPDLCEDNMIFCCGAYDRREEVRRQIREDIKGRPRPIVPFFIGAISEEDVFRLNL